MYCVKTRSSIGITLKAFAIIVKVVIEKFEK